METWKPNEKQTEFLKVLGNHPDGMTLAEASKEAGIEFKTGTTNPLISKGYVQTEAEPRVIECPCCGHKTKVKVYKLASK